MFNNVLCLVSHAMIGIGAYTIFNLCHVSADNAARIGDSARGIADTMAGIGESADNAAGIGDNAVKVIPC